VTVIVPCRNEQAHIEAFLGSLLRQEATDGALEFLIADGMSDDGTRERLQSLVARHPTIRVIDNPQGIVSTGLNAAIRVAQGEIIIRMDAHTEYAPDYIQQCVRALELTEADNVGGAWRATGRTYLQRAIAAAFQSPFSSGGAASHAVDYEGAVDSVYLGCWRKATLQRLGGFDEELVRNQDDELNLRLSRGGGRIWQSKSIRSWYSPRASIVALFRQYAQYGYWKVRVIQKHRLPASVRHLAPAGFIASLIVLASVAPFSLVARWGLCLLLALYLLANVVASILTGARPGKLAFLPVLPPIFAAYHLGYGYGFLRGIVDFLVLRRGANRQFSRLTRAATPTAGKVSMTPSSGAPQ
jgi:glycosyltransferase involved in cell wall biosynthesis